MSSLLEVSIAVNLTVYCFVSALYFPLILDDPLMTTFFVIILEDEFFDFSLDSIKLIIFVVFFLFWIFSWSIVCAVFRVGVGLSTAS